MTMKSDRKATHFGECQCCGSRQKLPLGVLAQHGYEVQWHEFQGVCIGRGHLPYEVSCELLPGLIEAAKIRRKRMKEAQRDLREPTTANRVDYLFDRRDRRFEFDEAAHIEAELRTTASGRSWLAYFAVAERDGLRESVRSRYVTSDVTGALSLINVIRIRQADAIEPNINAEANYIRWQQKRLADWKLRPLQEVVVEVEAAEAAKKREVLDGKKRDRDATKRAKVLRDGERAAKLIAKYEKLVPADIRANLANYTYRSAWDELRRRRRANTLPPTVDSLLGDMIHLAHGEKVSGWHADPWKQVEAANAAKETK